MKKSFIFSLMLILFFSTLLSADNVSILDAGNLTAQIDYVPGELLVKYKKQFRIAASTFYKTNWNISTIRTFNSIGCQHVKLPQGMTVEQAMNIYRNDPDVEYTEPNYIHHATLTPNDTSFNELWGLHNTGQTGGTYDADIDATEAWDILTGSDTVVIAVVDSGVKYDHEDLIGNIWSNTDESLNGGDTDGNGYVDDIRGWDFVDNDNDPMDYSSHGTHVAGIIAAVGNNSLGVTGVCWTAKIMPIRTLDSLGSGYTSDLLSAIEYANANGAHVINYSGGSGNYSQSVKDAIDASSAVVVCAAGNLNTNNDTTPFYPSGYTSTNIISVAATDHNDNKAYFSNYGETSVDVGAPGRNIYSTVIARHDVFSDNFNDGNINGWSHGGTNDTWGVENNSLSESPGGDYVSNTDSWIRTTSAISLSGQAGIRLEFQLRGSSEYGDFLHIDTSPDGSTWTNIISLYGSANSWISMEYDINTYAGGNVYIRFRFTSNGSGNDDGWDIDDVKVTAYTSGNHNSYDHKQGTSMATPFVSGIAGLIKASNPTLTNIQIKSLIESNVDTLGSLSGLVATGGRVNVNNIFPAAPSDLTATVFSATRIDLEWTDNSSNETGFSIERKTGAGGTWSQIDTVTANTTTYNNTGLTELTNYHYRVYAYKTVVNSHYSNEDDATTHGQAPGSIQFSAATYTIDENGSTASITVTRTGGSDGTVNVDYTTNDGTASAGSDYTAASGTLNWSDGETDSQTFTVDIIDDTDVEGDETVNLTLSNASGGATLGSQKTATLRILDDDSAGGGGGGGGCFIATAAR